jgi:hypothetical protein
VPVPSEAIQELLGQVPRGARSSVTALMATKAFRQAYAAAGKAPVAFTHRKNIGTPPPLTHSSTNTLTAVKQHWCTHCARHTARWTATIRYTLYILCTAQCRLQAALYTAARWRCSVGNSIHTACCNALHCTLHTERCTL